jgi:hypothetical protein
VARESSDRAVATVYSLALRLGKIPVVVADGPGFLVNRILGPYLNEAGTPPGRRVPAVEDDRSGGRRSSACRWVPMRLLDEVGIDVARHAGEVLHEAFGERMAPSGPLVAVGESDRLGVKGDLGFYQYENGQGEGRRSPRSIRSSDCLGPGLANSPLAEEEIRARLILVMINEASRVLEDGIAKSAGDVDLAMIMGTGFPPFRGGLLRFADELHAASGSGTTAGIRGRTRFSASPLHPSCFDSPQLIMGSIRPSRASRDDRFDSSASYPAAGRSTRIGGSPETPARDRPRDLSGPSGRSGAQGRRSRQSIHVGSAATIPGPVAAMARRTRGTSVGPGTGRRWSDRHDPRQSFVGAWRRERSRGMGSSSFPADFPKLGLAFDGLGHGRLEMARADGESLILPEHRGGTGHPALLAGASDRRTAGTGSARGSTIRRQASSRLMRSLVPVDDPGIHVDIDTLPGVPSPLSRRVPETIPEVVNSVSGLPWTSVDAAREASSPPGNEGASTVLALVLE